jgi:hypothetical protein
MLPRFFLRILRRFIEDDIGVWVLSIHGFGSSGVGICMSCTIANGMDACLASTSRIES